MEATVTINGIDMPTQPNPRTERIEQCGNRILIASEGLLHEVFDADNTLFNGVNDVDTSGLPLHVTGRFDNNIFILTSVVADTTLIIPDITREIIQDDDGNDVLQLINPMMGGTRYLVKDTGTVSIDQVTGRNHVKAAPNPFQDQTLVTWDNAQNQTFQAHLFTLRGQVLRSYPNVTGNSLLIEKGDLSPGLYFLNIVNEAGNRETVKLLLQK